MTTGQLESHHYDVPVNDWNDQLSLLNFMINPFKSSSNNLSSIHADYLCCVLQYTANILNYGLNFDVYIFEGFLMVANADDDADYSHKQWSGITDKWIQHDTWLKIADFSRNSLAWYMESETSTDHSSGYWFGSYSFVFMLIICVSLLAIYIIKSKVKHHGVSTNRSYQRTRIQHFQSGSGRPKLLYMLFVVLFFVSYVWESINLYQQEVAKKVAAVVKLSRVCFLISHVICHY